MIIRCFYRFKIKNKKHLFIILYFGKIRQSILLVVEIRYERNEEEWNRERKFLEH